MPGCPRALLSKKTFPNRKVAGEETMNVWYVRVPMAVVCCVSPAKVKWRYKSTWNPDRIVQFNSWTRRTFEASYNEAFGEWEWFRWWIWRGDLVTCGLRTYPASNSVLVFGISWFKKKSTRFFKSISDFKNIFMKLLQKVVVFF